MLPRAKENTNRCLRKLFDIIEQMKSRHIKIFVLALSTVISLGIACYFLLIKNLEQDIVCGFQKVDASLQRTNTNLNRNTHRIIEVLPDYKKAKAKRIVEISDSVTSLLEKFKNELTSKPVTNKLEADSFYYTNHPAEIKNLLIKYKEELFKNFPKLDSLTIENKISTDDYEDESWEKSNFYMLPAGAIIANLTKFQSDIENLTSSIISDYSNHNGDSLLIK